MLRRRGKSIPSDLADSPYRAEYCQWCQGPCIGNGKGSDPPSAALVPDVVYADGVQFGWPRSNNMLIIEEEP